MEITTAYVWPAMSACPSGGRMPTQLLQMYALRSVVAVHPNPTATGLAGCVMSSHWIASLDLSVPFWSTSALKRKSTVGYVLKPLAVAERSVSQRWTTS